MLPHLPPDDLALLAALLDYKRLTTTQLYRYVLPTRPKRYVERRLAHLRSLGLIEAHLLYPEQGARSPRYFHLLLAGARAVGKDRLGSEHYRTERREFIAARSARLELELLARKAGWQVFHREAEMRQVLLAYLTHLAASEHGQDFPMHTLATLLPARLRPDLVLVTASEAIPIVIAHPYAGTAFWQARLTKYAPVITRVRAVGVALSPDQHAEAQAIVGKSAWPRRYLMVEPHELSTLLTRLA